MLPRSLAFVVAVPLAALGCLSSAGSSPNATPGSDAGGLDGGIPVETIDGSVFVDGGIPALVTGLGSGQVEHSEHFTLITKTGDLPGGAGVKSSASFHIISGAAPASSK